MNFLNESIQMKMKIQPLSYLNTISKCKTTKKL